MFFISNQCFCNLDDCCAMLPVAAVELLPCSSGVLPSTSVALCAPCSRSKCRFQGTFKLRLILTVYFAKSPLLQFLEPVRIDSLLRQRVCRKLSACTYSIRGSGRDVTVQAESSAEAWRTVMGGMFSGCGRDQRQPRQVVFRLSFCNDLFHGRNCPRLQWTHGSTLREPHAFLRCGAVDNLEPII